MPDGISSYKDLHKLGPVHYGGNNFPTTEPAQMPKELIDRLESGDLDGAMELIKEGEQVGDGSVLQLLSDHLAATLEIVLSLFRKNKLEKGAKEKPEAESVSQIEKIELSADEKLEEIAEEALLIAAEMRAGKGEKSEQNENGINQQLKQLLSTMATPAVAMAQILSKGYLSASEALQALIELAAKMNPFPKMIAKVSPPIEVVLNKVFELFSKTAAAVSNIANAVVTQVVKVAEPVLNTIAVLTKKIVTPLVEFAEKIAAPIASAAKKIAQKTAEVVEAIQQQCTKIAVQVWSIFSPLIVPIAAQISQVIAFSFQKIIKAVERPIKSAAKFIKKVYKKLERAFQTFKRAVISVAEAAWNYFLKISEKITSWVLKLLLIIWNAILKTVDWIKALSPSKSRLPLNK